MGRDDHLVGAERPQRVLDRLQRVRVADVTPRRDAGLAQAREYSRVGFAPHDNAFTTIFFCLTGLHGAHVFVGLSILLAMTTRAFRGHFSPDHHHGVEIAGIYWHFVDVMWIVVYATVYIL